MFSVKSRKGRSVMSKYRYTLYHSLEKPSLLGGLARILDLGGTLRCDYRPSSTLYEKDIAAMRSDWTTVGQDIGEAIGAYSTHGTIDSLTHD